MCTTRWLKECCSLTYSWSKQTASKRPLVLHTLPPPPPTASSSSSPEPVPSTSAARISSKQVETAVDAIPKLVSILEIIKREFPSCSGAAKPNDLLPPLHQYTRLTTFESALDFQHLPSTESQAEDQDLEAVRQELVQLEWLSGRAGKAKRCVLSIPSSSVGRGSPRLSHLGALQLVTCGI